MQQTKDQAACRQAASIGLSSEPGQPSLPQVLSIYLGDLELKIALLSSIEELLTCYHVLVKIVLMTGTQGSNGHRLDVALIGANEVTCHLVTSELIVHIRPGIQAVAWKCNSAFPLLLTQPMPLGLLGVSSICMDAAM